MKTLTAFCKICKKNINGGISPSHVKGKKHMRNLPHFITVEVPCKRVSIEQVHKYFKKFGDIAKHKERLIGNYAIISYHFKDPEVCTDVVHKDHLLCGIQLKISWPNATSIPVEDSEKEFATFFKSQFEGTTFLQQVEYLQNCLQTDEAEVEKKLKIIRADLTEALVTKFPHCQVHFVGSTVTGLGLKWSNLDISITNVKSSDELGILELKAIKKLIDTSKKFSPVFLVKKSVNTIVCKHVATKISCNINAMGKLSIASSKLIKYYLTLDKKIKPLMIIIKLWADRQNFKTHNLLSGFALSLMVIFFLQQEPYNLPTVFDLQKDCPTDIEDTWNYSFSTPDNEFPALHNECLLNLVVGFFKFYSNFDYVAQFVCPFLGRAVKKTTFIKPYNLPDSYKYYMAQNKTIQSNSGICIQDPFEHNRYVSSLIPLRPSGLFTVLCKVAEQFASQTETDFLPNILRKCEHPPVNHISFNIEKPTNVMNEQEWFNLLKNFTVNVLRVIVHAQVDVIVNSDSVQILECICCANIWENRVNITKAVEMQLPPEANDFDVELAILPQFMSQRPHFFDKIFSRTNFMLILTMTQNPCRVEFVMKLKSDPQIFFHVVHYLRLRLPTWLILAANGKKPQPHENMEENSKIDEIDNRNLSSIIPIEIRENDKLNSENNDDSLKQQVDKTPTTPQPQSEESQTVGDTVDPPVSGIHVEEEAELIKEDPKPVEEEQKLTEESQKPTEEEPKSVQEEPEQNEQKPKPIEEEFKAIEEGEIVDEDSNEEEDVPADFFDDFANEDFMDGLNIVDAWNAEAEKAAEGDNSKESSPKKKIRSPKSPSKELHRKSSEKREKRARDRYRSRSRSSIRRRRRSRSRDRTDEIEISKYKEQKLVSEVVKFLDTGIVPPEKDTDEDVISPLRDKRRPEDSSDRERRYAKYSMNRSRMSSDSSSSECDLWLGSKRKRSRSRSADSSSRRKPRKYDDKPKKKSFLEEIIEKLNETHPTPVIPYPTTVPSTVFPTQNNQGMDQYDQRFFIGDAYLVSSNQTQNFNSTSTTTVSLAQVHTYSATNQNCVSSKVSIGNGTYVQPLEHNKQTMDDLEKLFAEKKISLSDYLTITAKRAVQSESQDHTQKKIMIISRCQQAIEIMSGDRRFSGQEPIKLTSKREKKPEMKYQSPLRKLTVVHFQYTTPPKVLDEVDSFAAALDKIVQKIGVSKETENLDQSKILVEHAKEEMISKILKPKTVNCERCRNCEHRESVSIAIQVNEEELDLTKKSLEDLLTDETPVQILSREKEKEKEGEKIVVDEKTEKEIANSNSMPQLMDLKVEPPPPTSGGGNFRRSTRDCQFTDDFRFNAAFQYFGRGRQQQFGFEDTSEILGPVYNGTPVHYPIHFVNNGQPDMGQLGNVFSVFNQVNGGVFPNMFGLR